MSPGYCQCLQRSGPNTSTPLSNLLQVDSHENRIPGHTRDCSLRSVSPLLDADLINRKLLPTDSADTAIAQQFAKRYELLRKENESLRQTVIQQEEQIEKLQTFIRSLQFDGYSSESRNDKSSSSNSIIPTLRVTPQKRSSTSSSTQTPRSPRSGRRASRRLQFPESSGSESTPTQRDTPQRITTLTENTTRRVLETIEPQLETRPYAHTSLHRSLDALHIEQRTYTRNTVARNTSTRRNTRPVAVSRTISSHDLSSQSTISPARSVRPASGPSRFVTDDNGNNMEISAQNPVPNLAFYLQRYRPDFLRESARRQQIVRQTAARRATIEAARKEIAINLINGGQLNKRQEEILKADTTRITAFPMKEMQEWTKKRLVTTREHLRRNEQKQNEIDRQANRFLAAIHSERTKSRVI